METLVVNKTAEDVWFDDFSISRIGSRVIQETHGAYPEVLRDFGGLELTGLGYQYAEDSALKNNPFELF